MPLILEVGKLKSKVLKLEKEVVNLTSFLLAYKPLTKQEVKQLVEEISQQPKVVEEQAINLLQKVQEKIDAVEDILHQLKQVVLG